MVIDGILIGCDDCVGLIFDKSLYSALRLQHWVNACTGAVPGGGTAPGRRHINGRANLTRFVQLRVLESFVEVVRFRE
jgi:hypothetical protein